MVHTRGTGSRYNSPLILISVCIAAESESESILLPSEPKGIYHNKQWNNVKTNAMYNINGKTRTTRKQTTRTYNSKYWHTMMVKHYVQNERKDANDTKARE